MYFVFFARNKTLEGLRYLYSKFKMNSTEFGSYNICYCLLSFITDPRTREEEEYFHLICDFIDDPQESLIQGVGSEPGGHNMNNNKDQSSNECQSHKSLFIVDWFLCPSPDECIQMEIAIHCTIGILCKSCSSSTKVVGWQS